MNPGFLVAPSAAMPGSGLIVGPDFDATMRAVVLWDSQELEGYIADFTLVNLDGDGALDIVLLVVHPTLAGFGTGRSSLLVYPLQAWADKRERGPTKPGQP